MRLLLLLLLLSACKTTTVQYTVNQVEYKPVFSDERFRAPLSDLDSVPVYRVESLEKIAQSLPQPIQATGKRHSINVRGVQAVEAPIIQGDSNRYAGRKNKEVTQEKTRNTENETGWIWKFGGIAVAVIAGLIFALSKWPR